MEKEMETDQFVDQAMVEFSNDLINLEEADVEFLDETIEDDLSFEDGDSDLAFIKMLQKHGRALLLKSQTPTAKKKKNEAVDVMMQQLGEIGFVYSAAKIKKKIENMKTRVKKKIDSKKTGNERIVLKPAEKLLLDALDAEDNPGISRLKCK